jgi:hypothetical protein
VNPSRAVFLLALAGCGAAETGVCQERSGTYLVRFQERAGGTCGARAPEVRRVNEPQTLPAGCAAPDLLRYSVDNCEEVAADVVCGDRSTTTRVLWSADGQAGAGTEELVAPGCSSTYDVALALVSP